MSSTAPLASASRAIAAEPEASTANIVTDALRSSNRRTRKSDFRMNSPSCVLWTLAASQGLPWNCRAQGVDQRKSRAATRHPGPRAEWFAAQLRFCLAARSAAGSPSARSTGSKPGQQLRWNCGQCRLQHPVLHLIARRLLFLVLSVRRWGLVRCFRAVGHIRHSRGSWRNHQAGSGLQIGFFQLSSPVERRVGSCRSERVLQHAHGIHAECNGRPGNHRQCVVVGGFNGFDSDCITFAELCRVERMNFREIEYKGQSIDQGFGRAFFRGCAIVEQDDSEANAASIHRLCQFAGQLVAQALCHRHKQHSAACL